MNSLIFFAYLVADVSALLEFGTNSIDLKDERAVTDTITDAIEKACQSIKDAGLDPLNIERQEATSELPVPIIFKSTGYVEEVLSNGLSNVVIHRMTYNIVNSRLNFDIEMPLIDFSVGDASAEATIFGDVFKFQTSGKVEIQKIRIVGQIRVNIGVISGISIRSIDITFTLGGIQSNVNLVIQDTNYSDAVNKFLGTTVPDTFKTYSSEINELLEILLLEFINANLKGQN